MVKSIYRPNRKNGQDVRKKRRPREVPGGAGRYALTVMLAAAVFAAGFLVGTLGIRTVPGFVKSHVRFPLAQVRISGNAHLAEDVVLAAADVKFGQNLLETDLEAIRDRLMLHPLVKSATVRRKLPSEIVVEVVERTPAAVVLDGRRYVVDLEGYVMALPQEGSTSLPCLEGLSVDGRRIAASNLQDLSDGIRIIAAIREAGFPSLSSLECIDLGRSSDAVLVPRSGRPLVHVGRTNVPLRLARWKAVVRDMAEQWDEIEYVDLRAEGMVVAKPLPPEEGVEKDKGDG